MRLDCEPMQVEGTGIWRLGRISAAPLPPAHSLPCTSSPAFQQFSSSLAESNRPVTAELRDFQAWVLAHIAERTALSVVSFDDRPLAHPPFAPENEAELGKMPVLTI